MAYQTFLQEYMQVPIVTRVYTTACVITTVAVVSFIILNWFKKKIKFSFFPLWISSVNFHYGILNVLIGHTKSNGEQKKYSDCNLNSTSALRYAISNIYWQTNKTKWNDWLMTAEFRCFIHETRVHGTIWINQLVFYFSFFIAAFRYCVTISIVF